MSSFSYEDTRAWESSEVMRELEKIAKEEGFLDLSEALQPIKVYSKKEEKTWEEEPCDKIPQKNAFEDINKQHKAIIEKIYKISCDLADNGNIKGAYRAERAISLLETLMLQGEQNNA
jgi:hypothetical protein